MRIKYQLKFFITKINKLAGRTIILDWLNNFCSKGTMRRLGLIWLFTASKEATLIFELRLFDSHLSAATRGKS